MSQRLTKRQAAVQDIGDLLAFIVVPTMAFFIASDYDWTMLLIAPAMWFVGFVHAAFRSGSSEGSHR